MYLTSPWRRPHVWSQCTGWTGAPGRPPPLQYLKNKLSLKCWNMHLILQDIYIYIYIYLGGGGGGLVDVVRIYSHPITGPVIDRVSSNWFSTCLWNAVDVEDFYVVYGRTPIKSILSKLFGMIFQFHLSNLKQQSFKPCWFERPQVIKRYGRAFSAFSQTRLPCKNEW